MVNAKLHQDQQVLHYGSPLESAKAAVILLHGRGATAQSMLELAVNLPAQDVAYLMPQAANNVWYPNSGFGPFEANEPYFSSAVATVEALVAHVNEAGIGTENIVLGGFSQGACLASEWTARHAARYGGLLVLSGALMGPASTPRDYAGSLDGTPIFIGGVNQDPWVTEAQLRQTAEVFKQLKAEVSIQVLPGSEHTIRPSEIEACTGIITRLV